LVCILAGRKGQGVICSEHVFFFSDLYEDPKFVNTISGLTFPDGILQEILKYKKVFLKDLDKEIINILGWDAVLSCFNPFVIV